MSEIQAAAHVLEGIKSPLVPTIFTESGRINWKAIQEQYPMLSSGEQTLANIALALWNGSTFDDEQAGFAAFLNLDRESQTRVLTALEIRTGLQRA